MRLIEDVLKLLEQKLFIQEESILEVLLRSNTDNSMNYISLSFAYDRQNSLITIMKYFFKELLSDLYGCFFKISNHYLHE